MEQNKKVTALENSFSLWDLINEELDYKDKKHFLDKCEDLSPERINEVILEAIKEWSAA